MRRRPTSRRCVLGTAGWYLGDGCLSAQRKGVFILRLFCDDAYPLLRDEVAGLVEACHPGSRVHRLQKVGCTELTNGWKHWPCLFPQHGPGMKHTRRIELADSQRRIVERHPRPLLRGLLCSDGCRVTNRVRRPVGPPSDRTMRTYAYPRYFFTNTSGDIRDLFCWALDLLGIAWRQSNPTTISVARRAPVAALDAFVGPKA